MAALPLVTLATVVSGAAVGCAAVALGRRVDGRRGWSAVAAVALGLVVAGYGLLHRLLCSGGPVCGPSASSDALAVGGMLGLGSLLYLMVLARR
jgi:hypothetical protein